MKRILAFFENKVESIKKDRQIKRCYRSLDIARDNALDAIDAIELNKSKLMEKLPEATNYDCILQQLGDYIGQQEETQAIIERIEKIKAYLDEDIKVDE